MFIEHLLCAKGWANSLKASSHDCAQTPHENKNSSESRGLGPRSRSLHPVSSYYSPASPLEPSSSYPIHQLSPLVLTAPSSEDCLF